MSRYIRSEFHELYSALHCDQFNCCCSKERSEVLKIFLVLRHSLLKLDLIALFSGSMKMIFVYILVYILVNAYCSVGKRLVVGTVTVG